MALSPGKFNRRYRAREGVPSRISLDNPGLTAAIESFPTTILESANQGSRIEGTKGRQRRVRRSKRTWLLAVCSVSLGCPVVPALALSKCIVGQPVTDPRGIQGVIVWGGGDFCRVKYEDGQSHGWASAELQPSESSPQSAHPKSQPGDVDALILRPSASALVYHADALGQFRLTADVNGVPIAFVVDTGATFVSLSLDDAVAAGIERGSLSFTAKTNTANGQGRAALVKLREVRIGQVSVPNVSAVVVENLNQSLLGMSLLNRLKGFEVRDGLLTISR